MRMLSWSIHTPCSQHNPLLNYVSQPETAKNTKPS